MPHDNTAPSARLSLGSIGASVSVYGTPAAAPGQAPGKPVITLGTLPSGETLSLIVTSREWLYDLTAAVQHAYALAEAEAGMKLVPR